CAALLKPSALSARTGLQSACRAPRRSYPRTDRGDVALDSPVVLPGLSTPSSMHMNRIAPISMINPNHQEQAPRGSLPQQRVVDLPHALLRRLDPFGIVHGFHYLAHADLAFGVVSLDMPPVPMIPDDRAAVHTYSLDDTCVDRQ